MVKHGEEVVIPREDRAAILEELHSTHLGIHGMKKLARGRMVWKGMSLMISSCGGQYYLLIPQPEF